MASLAIVLHRGSACGRNFLTAGSRTSFYPGRLVGRRNFSPLAWYNKQLKKAPIITKSITSGILFGGGDVLAQLIIGGKEDQFDWMRTMRAAIFGTVLLGPLSHYHFNFLEYLVVSKIRVQGAAMPFVKMFIDQFTYWAPGINAIYLFTLPILQGKSGTEAAGEVKDRLLPVLKSCWMVWPIAQTINFKLVPVAHQLNFVLVVSLFWACYLSWFNSKQDRLKADAVD